MDRRPNKFYLIEKYQDDWSEQRPFTNYAVTRHRTLDGLMRGLQEGPRHSGKLIPTQAIEFARSVREEAPQSPGVEGAENAHDGADTFYLLEAYQGDTPQPGAGVRFDVRQFRTQRTLREAMQKGNRYHGTLIPTIELNPDMK